jgi:hypothetical protein
VDSVQRRGMHGMASGIRAERRLQQGANMAFGKGGRQRP